MSAYSSPKGGLAMLRAAVYARYSSALQQPSSIEDQVTLCRQQASRFSCTVLEEHVYADREVSGSEERREGYQRLLAAARDRAFEAIIVEGQDRLWRNQAEMHAALEKLRFWGIKVFSLATGTDLTDRAGRLIATVMGWKDEAYLEDLRDKTRRGLSGQVRRGFSAGGRTYGYRTEPVEDRARADAHGQPMTVGYRKLIVEEEANVVRRIFEEFASGRSPKAMAHDLNRDRVPPPRIRLAKGWTWTAIVGNRHLGTGILNNSIYTGQVVWNRFRWDKNPETGKRVPRLRPRDDWVVREHPELRIVPQGLWEQVKARQADEARRAEGWSKRRHQGKYLFSGLLRCGVCGANYIVYNATYYACSAHTNRGSAICPNGKVVRRTRLEERLLASLYEAVFTPEAIAYLRARVDEALQRLMRQRAESSDKKDLERQIAQAAKEQEHIKEAIRRGLIGDITREMLKDVEVRIRELRAQLETPAFDEIPAFNLREVVESKLKDLASLLGRDVERSRALLRELLGEVLLQPTAEGVVAELRGNVEGLLPLEKALTGLNGSGGRIRTCDLRVMSPRFHPLKRPPDAGLCDRPFVRTPVRTRHSGTPRHSGYDPTTFLSAMPTPKPKPRSPSEECPARRLQAGSLQ